MEVAVKALTLAGSAALVFAFGLAAASQEKDMDVQTPDGASFEGFLFFAWTPGGR
jgi:hypothetical protein